MSDSKRSVISASEMNTFFRESFKGDRGMLPDITVAEAGKIVMSQKMEERNLRPPNYINGPTQMAMADHCAYCVIFTRLGLTPMAVTSNLNIDFLRPCLGETLRAEGHLIKLGRSLAVINVEMTGSDSEKLASRATVTYALPQN